MSRGSAETAFLNEFKEFLRNFSNDDLTSSQGTPRLQGLPFYIRALHEMCDQEESTLFVDFEHVFAYSEVLAETLQLQFFRFEPYMREAVFQLLQQEKASFVEHRSKDIFAVGFYNLRELNKIRDMRSARLGQLCAISGTVTRTSQVRPELVVGNFTCRDCQTEANDVEQQFKYTEPTMCRNAECANRTNWHLRTEDSRFVDWQKLRIQEDSSEIPAGSMPRTMDVIVRNSVVEKAKAGDKCVFVGSLVVVPDVGQMMAPGTRPKGVSVGGGARKDGAVGEGVTGLKALGVRDLTYKTCFLANNVEPLSDQQGTVNIRDDNGEELLMTEEEKSDIKAMFEAGSIYSRLARSICPHVFGHDDIKRGILLMMVGGVHKEVTEGMQLRGDINICVVGDPSTAKSQFLKYVKDFLPRAVYTSGKASSAAGLTATVVRDSDTGEFGIEAGALMLADNGICCIDEFDKMDVKDQVAIHEAMEQQTISISKAGVQATLNARTSVLAAANPVDGRYDKSRSLKANINMSAAIMSRFDLFFVIIDECDEVLDFNLARHIVSTHKDPSTATNTAEFSKLKLQRYIRFARTLKPKMTKEAAALLVNYYSRLRQGDVVGAQKSSYRITVRQLESMIRLSEALARVHLSENILPAHVTEAHRLLQRSIIRIESHNIDLDDDDVGAQLQPNGDGDVDKQADTMDTRQDQEQPKQQSKPIPITFERYQQITHMLVHHIRHIGGDGEDAVGVSQRDCVEWYLSQQQLDTEEALVTEGRLIRNLISRLVSKDFVLISVEDTEEQDSRALFVNPNFNVDGN